MTQPFFVLELAHSLHGRVKRIQVSYRTLYYLLGSVAVVGLVCFFLLSSYVRMTWKAYHYNELRANFDHLRSRYEELQRISKQRTDQIATLQNLASEVSIAYGVTQQKPVSPDELATANPLTPTVEQTIGTYNFLMSGNLSGIYDRYPHQWQVNTQPSLWPVNGILRSSFGARMDPFSGEGAFHKGVDLTAPRGTPVHVTADGVVLKAQWDGGYGKLVVVDHGNGIETYYAHLSQFMVIPGQEVRRGQVVALSGGTGHATGPHLHYEVRLGGIPVNPYKYLAKSTLALPTKPAHSDLGL
jgi:murein DD-endopeptidase MepM/ murein hydrolase activator NlpD